MTKSHGKKSGQYQGIDHTVQGQSLVIIQFGKICLLDGTGTINGLHQSMINSNGKKRDRDAQLPEDQSF